MKKIIDYIEQLWDKKPEIASEHFAYANQVSAVEKGFLLIDELIEPFQKQKKAKIVTELCVHLHLYARVLDDAVDEALPIHRVNLLKIQPFFWDTVTQLSILFPDKINAMSSLIDETIQSVVSEWNGSQIAIWAQKNHHLLLAPLLLSDSIKEFQLCKPNLSKVLFLLQAKEELFQLRSTNINWQMEFFNKINELISTNWIDNLYVGGWKILAERIPLELDTILTYKL